MFHFESVEIEKSKKARDAVNMTEVIETAKKLYGNIDVDEKGHFTLEDIKPFFKNLYVIKIICIYKYSIIFYY